MRFICWLVLLLLLAGCGQAAAPTPTIAPTPTPAPQSTPTSVAKQGIPVRVGYIPVTIYAPLYIALEKGYFAEEGIDARFVAVEGGADHVVQVASGNFDVAGGGVGAGMLNAVSKGIEFEIVAPLHTERPPLTSPFVVAKKRFDSGELTQISDLRGKRVSTNAKGSATEYWLWKALQQGGLDFSDVTVTGMGFGEVAQALQDGRLDGAILGEPLVTMAEGQGLVHRLSQDFITDFTPTFLYFNKKWASRNPELARKFVKAYLRGARDLLGEQWFAAENLAIIEKYTKVPSEVIQRANRSYHDPNGRVPVNDLMTLQDFFRVQGQLEYAENIDLSRFVNQEYANESVQALGGPVNAE